MDGYLWMTAILLAFWGDVFTAQSQAPNCQARTKYIQHVVPHSQVSIACPNLTGDDLRFHLLGSVHENSIKIHTTVLKKTKEQNRNHTGTNRQESFVQFGQVEPALNQNLSNSYVFTVNGTGLYSCKAERMWPPPYKEDTVETMLIEGECQNHQVPQENPICPEDLKPLLLWLLLVGCGVLFFYSVIITIITIFVTVSTLAPSSSQGN
ncbi:cytotoxic T-lymphocyte protein 4-like isoform X2 [Esox lucius]|uniref:cytotoxic T-lymphocyte protein 4-like isoform X2 n=1 Tax=Esox lucius TaxID=8010 RepID=UPI001476C864|nr:cytotoxic T-lymphocyte protein 4-like isoform X2 [Esox lucius]